MWWDEQIGFLRTPDQQGNPEINGVIKRFKVFLQTARPSDADDVEGIDLDDGEDSVVCS
jgi:hypothetical protein